ncbi:MAG: Ig-like domain-containing protein [Candidatus Daviesbacteria bacterium]|nr:Ig-like domain-containing protein [Candidatus Daviesbacteria bacterium]
MINKFIVLIIGVLVIAIIFSFLVLTFPNKKPTQIPPILTMPTPQPTMDSQTSVPAQPLAIISSYPENNTQNIPPNTTLSFTFNNDINVDLISVKFNPEAQFNQTVVTKLLLIKPKTELKPSTKYIVEVFGKGMPTSYSIQFQTAAQNPTGTSPNAEGIKQIDDTLRRVQPDAYLANKLPFSTSDFSASSAIKSSTNNLYFVIVLQGPDKTSSKNAFLDWLRSLQLTEAQIQGLDIEYQ